MMMTSIIVLKESRHDCTYNNELFHKIGVVLKEYDNKIEDASPSKTFFFAAFAKMQEIFAICLFVCFVALRPKSTAMVMAGRSVHLTTLFPGQA